MMTDSEVEISSDLQWSCVAAGKPRPSVRWLRNGQPLSTQVTQHTHLTIKLLKEAFGMTMWVQQRDIFEDNFSAHRDDTVGTPVAPAGGSISPGVLHNILTTFLSWVGDRLDFQSDQFKFLVFIYIAHHHSNSYLSYSYLR